MVARFVFSCNPLILASNSSHLPVMASTGRDFSWSNWHLIAEHWGWRCWAILPIFDFIHLISKIRRRSNRLHTFSFSLIQYEEVVCQSCCHFCLLPWSLDFLKLFNRASKIQGSNSMSICQALTGIKDLRLENPYNFIVKIRCFVWLPNGSMMCRMSQRKLSAEFERNKKNTSFLSF